MNRISLLGAMALCAAPALAQNYNNSFDAGDPQGAALYGNGVVTGGFVRLTAGGPGQNGAMVLPTSAENVSSFSASFLYSFFLGTIFPADGLSFNLGVIPDGTIPGASELGPGNGLTIAIIIFDFDGDSFVPDMGLRVIKDGVVIASAPIDEFVFNLDPTPVSISLDLDGTLDVSFAGNTLVSNLQTNFIPQPGQRFGLAARTGGDAAEQRIDNLVVSPRYRQGLCSGPQAIRGDGIFGYFVGPDTMSQSDASCASTTQSLWFCWKAPGTGMARVSTVGLAGHDTVLTAFDGCAPCPAAFGELACNDDFSGLQSQIDFPTVAGATYLIRVSEFGGATPNLGPHAFSITSTEGCRADFNNDGSIDPDDLGDYINTYFGGCP